LIERVFGMTDFDELFPFTLKMGKKGERKQRNRKSEHTHKETDAATHKDRKKK
jgi:hypothetical protein